MKEAAFFEAAGRCLRRNGLAMVNVCLERKSDLTADKIAAGFKERGWSVRFWIARARSVRHRPGGKGEEPPTAQVAARPEAGAKHGQRIERHALSAATVDFPKPRKRPVTAV